MNKQEIIQADQEYFMNVFSGRFPLVADHGQGIKVFDKDGREYLDFLAGIGVNILGYNHPELTAALESQVNKITHCSNLYYIEPQAKLEKLLVQNSVADRVFFTNSGAEANEGALKLARKYNPDKFEIISAERSFHGRTLGTLAATGQKKYREPFQPLPGGFKYIPYNDLEAARKAVGPETAAIILEPIQGEGGLYPAKASYLKGIRRLCDRQDILLIFDEIQCGMGRTGHLFAFEKYGIEPDIFTLAKGLGGGIPVGAFLATEEVAQAFEPGDHGSTFGGNHLACQAGYTTVKVLLDGLLDYVNQIAPYFQEQLSGLVEELPGVRGYRGHGLMLALELSPELEAKQVVQDMFDRGFLINAVQDHTLRFLPPFVVSREEIDQLTAELKQTLKDITNNRGEN